MTETRTPADPTLVRAFAARAAALPPEAWDRIAARCALLDQPTVEAFLGRVELAARAHTPETDPYTQPFVRSTMATIGGVFGVLMEIAARLAPIDPETFERAARRHAQEPPTTPAMSGWDAMMRIQGLAQRHQDGHPGTAAALRAVGFALAKPPKSRPAMLEVIYAPFEPEIPLASLPSPEPPA